MRPDRSWLRLALDDEVDAAPSQADITPMDRAPEPERNVPRVSAAEDPRPFDAIRNQLSTPIVNSLWRHLAGLGLLAPAWDQLRPHTPAAVEAGGPVGDHARALAADARWPVAASPSALALAGCADAAGGMSAVLDAYLLTLPRVLALVAGCAPPPTFEE